MDVKLLEDYPKDWMRYLREGHKVFLVKEKSIATIGESYIPSVYRCGSVFVSIDNNGFYSKWFVTNSGKGLDGNPLMLPIEGNLSENKAELLSKEAEVLRGEIDRLESKLDFLMMNRALF